MIATYINALAIIAGSLIGLVFKKYISDRFKKIVFQATGLATLLIGILMVGKCRSAVLCVFALILGGILGESLKIEQRIEKAGEFLKSKFDKNRESRFTEGFINTSLTFCVGAMAIIGSINASAGSYSVIFTKSLMDGSISIVFASVMGFGVLFSSVSVLIYQGAVTLLASSLLFIKSPEYLDDISGVGGVLIVGIGINVLDIQKIRVGNLVPAIFLIILFKYIKLTYF
jgi:uncharacterized membrane protein YqgA involved in biofilm formation